MDRLVIAANILVLDISTAFEIISIPKILPFTFL